MGWEFFKEGRLAEEEPPAGGFCACARSFFSFSTASRSFGCTGTLDPFFLTGYSSGLSEEVSRGGFISYEQRDRVHDDEHDCELHHKHRIFLVRASKISQSKYPCK